MPTALSSGPLPPPAPASAGQPRWTLVTGAQGAGKTRWLREQLESRPARRSTVLLAEHGRTRLPAALQNRLPVSIREFASACLCCRPPGFDEAIRAAAEENSAGAVFIEAPALGVTATIGWIERCTGLPLFVVACLDRRWAKGVAQDELSPFQAALLARADAVVCPPVTVGPIPSATLELCLA